MVLEIYAEGFSSGGVDGLVKLSEGTICNDCCVFIMVSVQQIRLRFIVRQAALDRRKRHSGKFA